MTVGLGWKVTHRHTPWGNDLTLAFLLPPSVPPPRKQVRRIFPIIFSVSWAQTPSPGFQHHCTLSPSLFNPAQGFNVPSMSLFPIETCCHFPTAPSQHLLVSIWTCLCCFPIIYLQDRANTDVTRTRGQFTVWVCEGISHLDILFMRCFSDKVSCHLTYRDLLANAPS